MFVCFVPITANRIQNTIDPDNPSFGLYLGVVLFANLNGLGNSAVFGMTDEIKGVVKAHCCGGDHVHVVLDEFEEDYEEQVLQEPDAKGLTISIELGVSAASSTGAASGVNSAFVEIALLDSEDL